MMASTRWTAGGGRQRGFVFVLWIAGSLLPLPSEALPWTRVVEVPASDVFSLQHHLTTLYAGSADIVYIGASEGMTWSATTPVDAAAAAIETVVPVGGALWAGTFAQGAYRSTDGGTHWDPVNTGLSGLGANAVIEIVEKSGKLYAGTGGAGVFVLDLAVPTQWTAFNSELPVLTAGTVEDLVLHGTTLVAPAGPNGYVYRFPEGATAWQEVAIVPPIAPGLMPSDLLAVGVDLFVGASHRVYRSEDDAQTWTFVGNGIASGTDTFLASDGPDLFAGVDFQGNNFRVYRSSNRGDSWQQIDEVIGSFLFALQVAGDRLFAARSDGLWWTPLTATGVHGASWGGFKSRFKD